MLVSDIDGTLVTPDKVLTPKAAAAVARMGEARILFTLISSRPPRGMCALVSALNIRLPFAAFNGGSVVAPDGRVLEPRRLSEWAARTALDLLDEHGVDAWVFADDEWWLRDPSAPYVAAHRRTMGFDPVVAQDFMGIIARIDKIVAVSDSPTRLAAVEAAARIQLVGKATIDLSQPYYLDITHPEANKGRGVLTICAILGIDPGDTAVVGDMMNDLAMFQVAGLAIAMGQAPDAVKAGADKVAHSNAEEGFADAVQRFVISGAPFKRRAS